MTPILTGRRISSGLSLLAGLLLGALLMFMGLAQAGRLAPARPEVLVALAQTLEVEHQRVDLLLAQKDVAGAISALEALRKLEWPARAQAGDAGEQLRHDVYGRLLRLRLDHPKVDPRTPDQLQQIADEGLGDDFTHVLTPSSLDFRTATWTWSREAYTGREPANSRGDIGKASSMESPWGRWRYVETLDVFLWTDGPSAPVECEDGVMRDGVVQFWHPTGAPI